MTKHIKISIKTKLLIIIIPSLICSFLISGYISVATSRKSLSLISAHFMLYKSEQIHDYATDQWNNFQKSSFANEPIYENVVKKSIESYVRGMIRSENEVILALDNKKSLVFSTSDKIISLEESFKLYSEDRLFNEDLLELYIYERVYIGMSIELPEFGWKVFLMEDKDSFLKSTRLMTMRQFWAFGISLVLILSGLLVAITIFIAPLHRFRNAIRDISGKNDFSRKIRIEYPDEIGELAYEFNEMTTYLDLSYKKLKKHAIDEAIANREIKIRETESLETLGRASDYKDPETGAHIKRVSEYCLVLAKALGQSESLIDLLYLASPLHDIGKLGIPDVVLLKPGKLNKEEFSIIKTHTTMGYEILKNATSKYLKAGAIIALSHHEKFDGTGYPKGLKGEDIPILGRIVCVADIFDALTTKRPYKEPWPMEKAINLIKEGRGTQFDPSIADAFLDNLDKIRLIHKTIED